MNNKYTGNFTKDEVPSAITQGETLNEAKKNLKEAIQYMLEVEAKLSIYAGMTC